MTNEADQGKPSIERLSSDKLMGIFSRTPFAACIILAIVLHAAMFGSSAVSYLLGKNAAKNQPAADGAGAATNAAAPGAATTGAVLRATATNGADAASAVPTAPEPATLAAAPDPETAEMERHKATPTVQAISEAAKPEDIPQAPDDIGISIDDTNPF